MPKICYIQTRFSSTSVRIIDEANAIIEEYMAQGYALTLRQLYYQFVARDLLPNTMRSYKRLGSIINDARLAGQIDWQAIEDRTRNMVKNSHWSDPADIMESSAAQFQLDKWHDQRAYVEVWVEKEALAGVIAKACRPLDVPYFCCRGYTSQSEMWEAAMRLKYRVGDGKEIHILHLGDHDPSGIDMTRDIVDRMNLFLGGPIMRIDRLALNMDQVRKYKPPSNPAKMTDSRWEGYVKRFSNKSWELDALEPRMLEDLIQTAIRRHLDIECWDDIVEQERQHRDQLKQAARRWPEVVKFLNRPTKKGRRRE